MTFLNTENRWFFLVTFHPCSRTFSLFDIACHPNQYQIDQMSGICDSTSGAIIQKWVYVYVESDGWGWGA